MERFSLVKAKLLQVHINQDSIAILNQPVKPESRKKSVFMNKNDIWILLEKYGLFNWCYLEGAYFIQSLILYCKLNF